MSIVQNDVDGLHLNVERAMRYLVTAQSEAIYQSVSMFLMECYRDNVRVVSERRRMLAVEDIPERAVNEIRRRGASVEQEFQYDMESHCAPTH